MPCARKSESAPAMTAWRDKASPNSAVAILILPGRTAWFGERVSATRSTGSDAGRPSSDLPTRPVAPATTIGEAWHIIQDRKFSVLPVTTDDRRLVGLLSREDFLDAVDKVIRQGTKFSSTCVYVHFVACYPPLMESAAHSIKSTINNDVYSIGLFDFFC